MRTVLLAINSLTLLFNASFSAGAFADGNHEHKFANDVHAFHERLSPLWHAPTSPERLSNTCNAVPDLVGLAAAIKSTDASKLRLSLQMLQKQCANEPRDIEQPFTAVHEAFHELIGEHS